MRRRCQTAQKEASKASKSDQLDLIIFFQLQFFAHRRKETSMRAYTCVKRNANIYALLHKKTSLSLLRRRASICILVEGCRRRAWRCEIFRVVASLLRGSQLNSFDMASKCSSKNN